MGEDRSRPTVIAAGSAFVCLRVCVCAGQWHPAIRFGPLIGCFLVGIYHDDKELKRSCKEHNPLPRWAIERAVPVDVMLAEKKKFADKKAPHQQITEGDLAADNSRK